MTKNKIFSLILVFIGISMMLPFDVRIIIGIGLIFLAVIIEIITRIIRRIKNEIRNKNERT